MNIPILATILVTLITATLPSQQVRGGADTERQTSTVHIASDITGTLAAVSIGYTAPTWRDGYDDMMQKLQGSNYTRLGNGWWTSFDTIGPLQIGDIRVEAGSYYLGLSVAADGTFSLLLFDSKATMKARLLPATTALYTGEARPDVRIPMNLAKDSLPEPATKMQIEITAGAKNPSTGKLSIRWGKHELSAPVEFRLGDAKDTPKK